MAPVHKEVRAAENLKNGFAVGKPHNFPARILFTETTYNGKLLYSIPTSTISTHNTVERTLNWLKLGIS